MKILYIDAYNLMHRARFSFTKGEYSTVFNFFRGIRPLIEQFDPDSVYFVLDGYPKDRISLYPEYKANRREGITPDKMEALDDFKVQKDIIISIVDKMPFTTIYHPDYECDDIIASACKETDSEVQNVILSNDSDFLQVVQDCKNTSLFSPVKKQFLYPPEYSYLSWKALVGDASDNIKGVPRIGDKTAQKILQDGLDKWLNSNAEGADIYRRNLQLISFREINIDNPNLQMKMGSTDFKWIKERFEEMSFDSLTNDKSWAKFEKTFEKLTVHAEAYRSDK